MTTYDNPPKIAEDMLAALIADYAELADLKEAGVRIDLSWATAKEKKDGITPPALTHGGYPALAIAKIVGLQDRTHGGPDGRITVDSLHWDVSPDDERNAILFHELLHFEVVRTEDGSIKHDDAERPCLKMRKHDWNVGWFVAPARRFGKAAIECIQFRRIVEDSGQYLLPAIFGPQGDQSIKHGGDTLTIEQNGESVTIPAEDLARVHAGAERQLVAAQ